MNYHECKICCQQSTHGVADQDNICSLGFMWFQPLAQIIPRNLDSLVRLVARIDLGVDDMGVHQSVLQVAVDMSREGTKRCIVAHEAVDVDNQQNSPLISIVHGLREGLGARRARVALVPL